MPTLSDARFDALRGQGFTGATSDMLLAWLQSGGATSPAIPDAWEQFLAAQGFPYGHRNDSWYVFLGSLGYTGSLNDRELAFWVAGGVIGAAAPLFFNQPDPVTTVEGLNVTFTAQASGSPPPSYQWQLDTVDIPGATGTSYSIPISEVSDNGSYRCVATNSEGSDTSDAAALLVELADYRTSTNTVYGGQFP